MNEETEKSKRHRRKKYCGDNKLSGCRNLSEPEHTCPYSVEINDNYDTCNCCDECRQECIAAI